MLFTTNAGTLGGCLASFSKTLQPVVTSQQETDVRCVQVCNNKATG